MEEKKWEEKKEEEKNREFKEIKEFIKEFGSESDRAAVILGAAKLDTSLYLLLTRALLPTAGNEDELFEGEAPLSSFSSKINLAYRLGLIDSQFAHALHLIRKIRNSFAHEVSGCSLSSGGQRDRVRELIAPLEIFKQFGVARKMFFEKDDPASDFRMALSVVLVRLETAMEGLQPIKEQVTQLIPPVWMDDEKEITPKLIDGKKMDVPS
jgi:hypothetical protein